MNTIPLPPIRTDLEVAKSDLDSTGIAQLRAVISREDLEEARASIIELAARESAQGTALMGGGPPDNPRTSQRVYLLVNKGPVWRRIATNPAILDLMHHILGPRILLHAMQAHLVGPAGSMAMHTDQGYVTPAVPFPVMATAMIMLDEFTEENGATRVVPGSHLNPGERPVEHLDDAIPLVGPPGTAVVYGGQLWHGTGANRTERRRLGLLVHYSCAWLRQFENYGKHISAEDLASFSPELRALLDVHEMGLGRGLAVASPAQTAT